MPLTLRFQTTGKVPGSGGPVVMVGSNLTIGRADGNDLVLPDPDRTISKRHCVLEERGGQIMVIDLSSNGTFLNYSKKPLGRSPLPINDGDILSVGPYELLVDLSEPSAATGVSGAAPTAPGPLDHIPPPLGSEEPGGSGDLLDDLLGPPGGGSGSPLIPEDGDDDILGPLGGPVTPPPEPFLGGGGPPSSPLDDFTPPAQKQDLIPEDWDIGLPSSNDQPKAPPVDPLDLPPAEPDTPNDPPAEVPSDPLMPAGRPRPTTAVPRRPAGELPPDPPPMRTAPTQIDPALRPPPETAPPPQTAAASAGPPSDAALGYLKALGVDVDEAGDLDEALARMGGITRIMIAGLRDILMTRTAIKGEFRMNQTVIRAEGNNPLKFSITEDQAVESLLRPPARGYMPPDQAVTEALDDIRAHEVAMVTGMQAALKGLLARLDPQALVLRLEEQGTKGSLFKAKKSQYWEIYEKAYADISKQAENDFQDLFQNEFAKAYQQQLEKLK